MELWIALEKALFHEEFGSLLAYIHFMEEFLDAEEKKAEENFQKILSQIDPDQEVNITDIAPGVTGEYAGMLRNSFFVSLYSFFESKLISECRSRKNDEISLGFDDIYARDELERVKKYFTKVLRIDFPSNSHEWQTIQYYRMIRNCIVHARGRITELREKDQEQLQRYIAKDKNIILFRNNEELYLERDFCEDACKTIEAFLMMVLFPAQPE